MKIFAVYGRLKLINKPKWLDEIINSVNFEYELHVTFKQPVFIKKNQADEVKNVADNFFNKIKFPSHKIKVVFDRIYPDSNYECVMIEVKDNPILMDFQKRIIKAFKKYSDYCKPETEKYEKSFHPHLSISLDLDKETYQKEIKKIPANFRVTGEIREIILVIVKEETPKEANDSKNLTIFKL
ncbi:hypothetical protein A3F08_00790 [Candidatus Berkelbacteria bacterium RIFCSPHIGHO2_12_FULL_36_9]|uniref:2'-5' RNA ligase n=1 Tax=Candidatus Berkelbacteria bacterium RIFCSPHIGHO2_12_FULL_36_9 TaxID=1797469 RepID=A0A1F5EJI5_9BACT|nr:MAG: hypothetical protein A3F08_00790 [Candidatus Berkelbacteria bacterium RIFCSPHIGHO2_12_FULL_36_9]